MSRLLQVTYSQGKPWVAYLQFSRKLGEKAVRTQEVSAGILIDFASDGRPMGVEILSPSQVELTAFNRILHSLGLPLATPEELAPLHTAAVQ